MAIKAERVRVLMMSRNQHAVCEGTLLPGEASIFSIFFLLDYSISMIIPLYPFPLPESQHTFITLTHLYHTFRAVGVIVRRSVPFLLPWSPYLPTIDSFSTLPTNSTL